VSLVDGKEYPVGPAGVTIGRDAASDIVVAERQVSRKHAVVAPTSAAMRFRISARTAST
jgi:hypothetical protein